VNCKILKPLLTFSEIKLTISDWNLLPSRLKDSATLDSFKNRLAVCYY